MVIIRAHGRVMVISDLMPRPVITAIKGHTAGIIAVPITARRIMHHQGPMQQEASASIFLCRRTRLCHRIHLCLK